MTHRSYDITSNLAQIGDHCPGGQITLGPRKEICGHIHRHDSSPLYLLFSIFGQLSLLSISLWSPLLLHFLQLPLWLVCPLRSALVLWRLGLSATQINLVYLHKALAFTHLYVPQSCYHKSTCLSTSRCMISTSAILTSLVLLYISIQYQIACWNLAIYKFPQNWYVSTTIHISLTWLTLE